MKNGIMSLAFFAMVLFVGCSSDSSTEPAPTPDFVGSWVLSGLALQCEDGEGDIFDEEVATGSLTINEDLTYVWSATIVDDVDASFSICLGGEIEMYTFTADGTVTHNGNSITFDNGETEPWTFEWSIDEDELTLEDDESAFIFQE